MIKIFADGADLAKILELHENPQISGFTTNPSLLRKAGVTDYAVFAKKVLEKITEKPVSFEVFSDDLENMEREARIIASWGKNVYVKIPPMTTKGIGTDALVHSLAKAGVRINVTCIFTKRQVQDAVMNLGNAPSILSIFAGRIMDTGVDATELVSYAASIKEEKQEVLWASSRELWNITQAQDAGADIITLGHDLISKMNLRGKDLLEFSKETVEMFYNDAKKSGYSI